MNLEKRIEALENESAGLAEPHRVVLASWDESKETEDEAVDRALAEAGMTREEISKPRLDGLPHVWLIHAIKSSRVSETTPAEPSAPVSEAGNAVNTKLPRPVKDRPLDVPITGIV